MCKTSWVGKASGLERARLSHKQRAPQGEKVVRPKRAAYQPPKVWLFARIRSQKDFLASVTDAAFAHATDVWWQERAKLVWRHSRGPTRALVSIKTRADWHKIGWRSLIINLLINSCLLRMIIFVWVCSDVFDWWEPNLNSSLRTFNALRCIYMCSDDATSHY